MYIPVVYTLFSSDEQYFLEQMARYIIHSQNCRPAVKNEAARYLAIAGMKQFKQNL